MTFLRWKPLTCCGFLIVGAQHRALSSLLGKGVFTLLGEINVYGVLPGGISNKRDCN
jgi:hypothetical protein